MPRHEFLSLVHINRDICITEDVNAWAHINTQLVRGEERNYYVAPAPSRAIVVCRYGLRLQNLLGTTTLACLHPSLDRADLGFTRYPGRPQRKLTIYRRCRGQYELMLSDFLADAPKEEIEPQIPILTANDLTSTADFRNAEPPPRVMQKHARIKRNVNLIREIKRIYQCKCQICGVAIELGQGLLYAEVHHIKPLGRPHSGPDVLENVICVCPNHHVQLDNGAIKLDKLQLALLYHQIHDEYIRYHNDKICGM